MPEMLKDKVVAITGAGRGIGREIALLAAAQGAKVVVNDFGGAEDGSGGDTGPAAEVVREIKSAGGQAIANMASVSDPAGAESIINDALEAFGQIDAVINNAGILRDRMFHKMSIEDFKQVIDVHLMGSFYVSKAAAVHFRQQGWGSYVHFTSTSGLVGSRGQANYAAAKMGIVGLSNSIAIDMKMFGVNSNCIAPFAWSRLIATIPVQTEADRVRVERLKTMSPAKVAPLAVMLVSDAAKQTSGQIFSIRKDEVFLFNLTRPIRNLHRAGGWSPETLASDMLPAFSPFYTPLQVTNDAFPYDPI